MKFKCDAYCHDLNQIDWSPVLLENDVDRAWEIFIGLFRPVCDRYAPFKKIKIKDKLPAGLTQEYFSASDERDFLAQVYKRTKNQADFCYINMLGTSQIR